MYVHPEVIERGPEAVAIYKQIIRNGETERWATMCALQQAPGSKNTDRAFSEGARRQMEQMDPYNRTKILERAKAVGINTQGKCYKGGLGHYTDPAAWVGSQDDVIAVAKAKNLNVEGVVNVKAARPAEGPPKKKPLAEDIVKREALHLMRNDGRLAEKVRKSPKAKQELRERIQATHGH